MKPKPNNSGKKDPQDTCYDVMIVNDCSFTDDANHNNKSNHNINNHNNHNNITNHNNHNNTSILTPPISKTDFVYYYLFDNGEKTGEEIIEAADISSIGSFNVLRNRSDGKITISRKKGTTSFYDISKEWREQIQLRINQELEKQKRQEENRAAEKLRLKEENASQEELISRFKEIVQNKTIVQSNNNELHIDLKELKEQEPFIYEQLLEKPEETMQILEITFADSGISENIVVRYDNLETINSLNIENYRSKHLGKAICSNVRVTSITAPRPLVTNASFECPSCGTIISVVQLEKKFKEPSRCSCGRRGGFKEIAKDMVDACALVVEDIEPESQIPVSKNITCFVKDHLLKEEEIEKFVPGNNIRIFGMLKEIAITSGSGAMLTRLDWGLEIFDIEEFDPELNQTDFSEEEIEKFKQVTSRVDSEGLEILSKSYAPEVHGYEVEKKALIIQSAQRRNHPKNSKKTKGHILIIGDPGRGKTKLSKFVTKTTQSSKSSSGSGSSGVGLTASVIKEENIGWVMKPGLLPLTRELVVIDEFNLIPEEDRPKLQLAMSDCKISVEKAGISASPSVTCGILALANPMRGTFDIMQPLVKQFNLKQQEIDRFDLIFTQIDSNSKDYDEAVVKRMLQGYSDDISAEYDIPFLRKFFTYVRNLPEPKLSKEANSAITAYYIDVKQQHKNNPLINITSRFVDSLTRVSSGHAKLRHSNIVSKKDVIVAYNIIARSYLNLKEIPEELKGGKKK